MSIEKSKKPRGCNAKFFSLKDSSVKQAKKKNPTTIYSESWGTLSPVLLRHQQQSTFPS